MVQTQHLSSATGVDAVVAAAGQYALTETVDGLEFASPDTIGDWFSDGFVLPARLAEFLADIRLLRRIPLSYLVPDADLLPPESIRFFHVNQTWVDRVIDGVVSNTNVGTVDFQRSLSVLQAIREATDAVPGQMTGMLIRSELVRRWPKMVVRAHSTEGASVDDDSDVEVVRAEPISRDVFIALFAGEPASVHLREPFDGVRYGVELEGNNHVVDGRNADGTPSGVSVPVQFHLPERRTLNIGALQSTVGGGPRGVALHLEQRPYVQVFAQSTVETEGSKPAPAALLLRNGRQIAMTFAHHALFQSGTD